MLKLLGKRPKEPARGSGSEDRVEGTCGHRKSTAPSGEGLRPLLAHFEASEWALLKVKTFHTRAYVSVCLQRKEGESGGCQGCFCGCQEGLGDRTLCTTNPLKITSINKHFHFSNYCHPLLSAQGPTFPILCFLWPCIACRSGKSHLQALGQAWAHTSNPRVQALTPASGMRPEEGHKVL